MTKMRKIKKGEMVMLSQGEYSDYSTTGLYKATKDFDPDALIKEWLIVHPEQQKSHSAQFSAFQKWLEVDLKLLKPLPYIEYYLGAYSSFDSDIKQKTGSET